MGGKLGAKLHAFGGLPARPSAEAHVRVSVPAATMADYLRGTLDKGKFVYLLGHRMARTALLTALGSMV